MTDHRQTDAFHLETNDQGLRRLLGPTMEHGLLKNIRRDLHAAMIVRAVTRTSADQPMRVLHAVGKVDLRDEGLHQNFSVATGRRTRHLVAHVVGDTPLTKILCIVQ